MIILMIIIFLYLQPGNICNKYNQITIWLGILGQGYHFIIDWGDDYYSDGYSILGIYGDSYMHLNIVFLYVSYSS